MSETSTPFGQCIKPQISTVSTNTTATDVLDFATKVAVSSTSTAVKAIDNTKVLPALASTFHQARHPNLSPINDKDQVIWLKIDDSLNSDLFSDAILEKFYGKNYFENKNFNEQVRRPVILYIGYNIGYSIWLVSVNSDSAYEIISNRDGPVNHVEIIPTACNFENLFTANESQADSGIQNLNSNSATGSASADSESNPSSRTTLSDTNFNAHLTSKPLPHIATVFASSDAHECELIISSLVKPRHDSLIHRMNFGSKIDKIVCNQQLLITKLVNDNISAFSLHKNYSQVFSLDFESNANNFVLVWGGSKFLIF